MKYFHLKLNIIDRIYTAISHRIVCSYDVLFQLQIVSIKTATIEKPKMKFLIFFSLVAAVYPLNNRCAIKCPRNIDPYCGNDGKTYPNECVMRTSACNSKQAIVAVRKGECPKDVGVRCKFPCLKRLRPVCGSDGIRYTNLCLLRQKSCESAKPITMVCPYHPYHHKDCSSCHIKCPRIYSPVCSQDGKTYDNWCVMAIDACVRRTALVVVYKGKCKE